MTKTKKLSNALNTLLTKKWALAAIGILCVLMLLSRSTSPNAQARKSTWQVQSVDTMKYSRDLSREKLTDHTFDTIIDTQVKNIAATGATHVAIGTPYDDEFIPILARWVSAARKYNLSVWFRGNFSGWEGWFDYPKISRSQHTELLAAFLEKNASLFRDGDIFSACPECENGGPGDPRRTGDVVGHRAFLIEEYNLAHTSFAKMGKDVRANYESMNGDVARLIMDKPTTAAMGGVVVVDHYVSSAEKLALDIKDFANRSGGTVVLGEVGAPIPDLHGKMTELEQAQWLDDLFTRLEKIPELTGINYWTSTGGSTELWTNGVPKEAVETLTTFFTPRHIEGKITNEFGIPVAGTQITTGTRSSSVGRDGSFSLILGSKDTHISVTAPGYEVQKRDIKTPTQFATLRLTKSNPSTLYKVGLFFYSLLHR